MCVRLREKREREGERGERHYTCGLHLKAKMNINNHAECNDYNQFIYHLQDRNVLLPPEVWSQRWSQTRQEVVGVHNCVDKIVYHLWDND